MTENGNLNTESPITRAELAKMLCVAGGLTAEGSTDASAFTDVTPAHWAYAYICAAKDAGLVVGDENGFFNPEAHVTNEETVKMIVSLIGYSPMAVSTGGFPAGYNATAARRRKCKLKVTLHTKSECHFYYMNSRFHHLYRSISASVTPS